MVENYLNIFQKELRMRNVQVALFVFSLTCFTFFSSQAQITIKTPEQNGSASKFYRQDDIEIIPGGTPSELWDVFCTDPNNPGISNLQVTTTSEFAYRPGYGPGDKRQQPDRGDPGKKPVDD